MLQRCAPLALCLFAFAALAEPPSQGLRLWLKPDALTGDDGAAVAQWGVAVQAKPEQQPLLVKDGIAGRAAVKFDGVDDLLLVPGQPLQDAPRFELFLVAKTGAASDQAGTVLNVYSGARALSLSCRPQYYFMSYHRDANNQTMGATARTKPDTAYLVDLIHDSAQRACRMRTNADTLFGTGTQPAFLPDTAFPGALQLGGPQAVGLLLSEVLIYDHELTEADRRAVEQYVAERYQLTVTPLEVLPRPLTAPVGGRDMTALGYDYPLAEATLLSVKGTEARKQLHGLNQWVFEGSVTKDAAGLRLDAGAAPAWTSPYLWSGLKDVRITARLRLKAAGEGAVCGLKLGRVWAIGAAGPRVELAPGAGTLTLRGDGGEALGSAKVDLPLDRALELSVRAAYEEQVCEVSLNGQVVLKLDLPREPFETFMARFGRPAPVTGVGVFADKCDLGVEQFQFVAGAPPARVVAFGDSITQQAYWVNALAAKLGEPITNLGIGGDSAKMAALRFERDVLPLKPEVVILFLGTNDIGWGSSPEAVAGSLAGMARQARAAGIKPVLAELLPRKGVARIPEYNAAIAKLAEAQQIPLLRWHAATLAPDKAEMREGFAPDGTHPGRLGAEAMVAAVDPALLR